MGEVRGTGGRLDQLGLMQSFRIGRQAGKQTEATPDVRIRRATIPVMRGTVRSVSGVTIRLTEERWLHITEEHAEVAGHLHDVLVYKEQDRVDGFVITAFLTRRLRPIEKRTKLWPH